MKLFKSYFFIFFAFLILACTPKTTEQIIDKTEEVVKVEKVECATFNDLGKNKNESIEAFILYKDQIKAKDFDAAYPLWQKAIRLAPKADGNKSYHYDDGIKIFNYFADKEMEEANRAMWADSVKMLYDQKEKCYGSSDELTSKKAYDLYYNYRENVGDSYLYGLIKKVVDNTGKDIPEYLVNPFSNLIVSNIISKSIEVEEGKKYANLVMETIADGIANCGDDCKNWNIINDYSIDRLAVLERFPAFYPCAYYVEKYYPEFQAASGDCEVIESVMIRLRRGGCEESDSRVAEVLTAYNSNCKKETTTKKGPLSEAFDFYRNGQYEEAVAKFDEYFATETNTEDLAKYQLVVAKIYYRDLKDFPKARKYALDAAANKGNWGEPYILIGKLYATSGPICGPGTGWKSQIVTWPAIDKWNYAKKIDSSVSSDANKLIKQYQKYMPSIEDIFSRPNVKEGGSFYVGCWIKESTIARAAK
jgi:hypothetical protein